MNESTKKVKKSPPTYQFVKLTKQGVDRVLGRKPGDAFTVSHFSTSADGYFVAHVKDYSGNVWSLGHGDWKPVESEVAKVAKADMKPMGLMRSSLR